MASVEDWSRCVSDFESDPATVLERLRRRIDELDAELVKLLNARAACAVEIGEVKHAHGMRVHQPRREQDVIAHVTAISDGPLEAAALTRLFERIIDETRQLQPRDGRPRHAEEQEGE